MTLLMDKEANVVMDNDDIVMNKYHPLAEILPSLVSNLWWNIVMDDW